MATTPPPAPTPAVQLPRIVPLLAAGGLALAANRYWPGTIQAVLLLLVLYVALTNLPRALAITNVAPAALAKAFRPAPVHTGAR